MNAEALSRNVTAINNLTGKVILEVKNLTKIYRLPGQEIHALQDVNFKILAGSLLAISGPSGSGKSTLLNIISLLDVPTQGSVHFSGSDVASMSDKIITQFRSQKVGIVFQNYNLIPVLSTLENVAFPLQLQSLKYGECLDRAKEMLDKVGLSKHLNHRPGKLSGGQRQRVAIARALVTRPELVVADEPTAALDSKTGMEIVTLMESLNQTVGTTFVFSTHDPRITARISDVIELVDGKVQGRSEV